MSARLGFVRHLRGRVTGPTGYTGRGHPIWMVEVINTRTGRVVNSDNAYSLASAYDDAAERTYVARAAWFYSYTKKGLK